MSKIKWGIIGTGSIANSFAHSIKHCNHSDLISVFGRNEVALAKFSHKFNIRSHSDVNSLL
jgi:predicted dehydrogenase